jgi:hypothetical protein
MKNVKFNRLKGLVSRNLEIHGDDFILLVVTIATIWVLFS